MFNVIWPLAKNLINVGDYNQTNRTNMTYQGLVEAILPDIMQNTAMKCNGLRGRTSKAQVLDHGPLWRISSPNVQLYLLYDILATAV